MKLLLGRRNCIEEYATATCQVEPENIMWVPEITVHPDEYPEVVERIKEKMPEIISSQNVGFIDYLLDTDLEFDVITAFGPEVARILSKEKAKEVYREMDLSLV